MLGHINVKHKSGRMTVHAEMCILPGAEEGCISGQYGAYFVLLGSIPTIVRSENPFVSPPSAPLPQGWVQSSAGNAMVTF